MLVYVVEDNKDINDIECYVLKTCDYTVIPLYSGAELRKAINDKIPDLIILDIMLPDDDGISIVGQMRNNSRLNFTPIILVTAKSSEMEKVRGLDAGADDYVTKPFGNLELVSRVKAHLRRAEKTKMKMKSDSLLVVGDITIDNEKREVLFQEENITLTYKEFELLKYLAINKGIVLSRDKIMENVWGFDFQGESRTVDMHIKTLRHKIGKENNIIKTVRNVGYKLS